MNIGDKAAYSAQFLRSIGQITGDLPAARGKVLDIKKISEDLQIAIIDWNNPDIPCKVNIKNLAKVGLNVQFSQC